LSMKSLASDRDHLTSQLYANEEPLAIRIATHQRYTVPALDFARWVLDLIPWQGGERVTDVGCGNGAYVEPAIERLTDTGRYLAGDLSLGMLRDLTRGSSQGRRTRANATNLDAAALPLPSGSCDVILANHMLYHVPDVEQAVNECHRVLRDGGQMLVATNSQTTMVELDVLIREGYSRLQVPFTSLPGRAASHFCLENGQGILSRAFSQVERHLLHSALVFPEPAPLLAYIDSLRPRYEPELPAGVDWDDLLQVWQELIAGHIARHDEFHVSKLSGAFVAVKGHSSGRDAGGHQ